MKVLVKWGKESYEVDVDLSLPATVFKAQLMTLTGVPCERQKVMGVKNAPLKARSCTVGLLLGI
jgi:ubiquitin carboxyl-terminal hydrolase 14